MPKPPILSKSPAAMAAMKVRPAVPAKPAALRVKPPILSKSPASMKAKPAVPAKPAALRASVVKPAITEPSPASRGMQVKTNVASGSLTQPIAQLAAVRQAATTMYPPKMKKPSFFKKLKQKAKKQVSKAKRKMRYGF